jgi:hypothetical protein
MSCCSHLYYIFSAAFTLGSLLVLLNISVCQQEENSLAKLLLLLNFEKVILNNMSNLNNYFQVKWQENSCLTALLTVQQFQSMMLILGNSVKNSKLVTSVPATTLGSSSPVASSCLHVVSLPNHKKQNKLRRCSVV